MVLQTQRLQICPNLNFEIFKKSQENQRKSTIGAFS